MCDEFKELKEYIEKFNKVLENLSKGDDTEDDNDFINYTIIDAKGDEYAEITFTLKEDYNCVVPTVKDIIISVEKDEVNFINNIKNIFS